MLFVAEAMRQALNEFVREGAERPYRVPCHLLRPPYLDWVAASRQDTPRIARLLSRIGQRNRFKRAQSHFLELAVPAENEGPAARSAGPYDQVKPGTIGVA